MIFINNLNLFNINRLFESESLNLKNYILVFKKREIIMNQSQSQENITVNDLKTRLEEVNAELAHLKTVVAQFQERDVALHKLTVVHEEQLDKLEEEHESFFEKLEERHEKELDKLSTRQEKEIEELQEKQEREIESLESKYSSILSFYDSYETDSSEEPEEESIEIPKKCKKSKKSKR